MSECLILGVAGVGKSSLVEELVRRDRLAFDVDITPGIGDWFDMQGNRKQYNPDPAWRASHQYLWNIDRLARLLEQAPENNILYMAGTATNLFDAIPLFRNVAFLDAGVDTICQRLIQPTRHTPYPFACNEEYKTQLSESLPVFKQKIIALGATILNAEQNIPSIADDLLAHMEKTSFHTPANSLGYVV